VANRDQDSQVESAAHEPAPGREHLWSQAVATGGNRWQIRWALNRLKQAKTVALGWGSDSFRVGSNAIAGQRLAAGLCWKVSGGALTSISVDSSSASATGTPRRPTRRCPWDAEIRSCGLPVLMQEPAEQIAAVHLT
jgi:hypothetical protein